MEYLVYFIIILGLFEIISNLYHLLKGNKESIGLSAKKQHQELSLELGYRHFYVKAIIMFIFGILFAVTGLFALLQGNNIFFAIVLGLFATYGIVQALYYKRPYKVWMSLVVYMLPFIFLLLLSGNANEANDENSPGQSTTDPFVFPFSLCSEPITRLLVMSIKGDSEYEIIEPQLYNDSVFGKGLRVLMYRTDKKIDVYYESGVYFDSTSFAVGKGLGKALEVPMSPARFEITKTGVDIDIAFTDYHGRHVELRIKEKSTHYDPFPFLAPVGSDVGKPSKLFLVYMHEFDFVKREGTEIRAKVGERTLAPATFPIKRNGKKVYFTRYASKLTIAGINPAGTTLLPIEQAIGNVSYGKYNFTLNKEHKVTNYWIDNGPDKIELSFETGFPNLLCLPQSKKTVGKWNCQVSGTLITGGTYTVIRNGDLVSIELDVTRKWKPHGLPISFKAFTYFMRSFRTWPTSYKWKAVANLNDMTMQGHWYRR